MASNWAMAMDSGMGEHFRIELGGGVTEIDAQQWDALVDATPQTTVFQRHAWLAALQHHGCVQPQRGWQPLLVTLRDNDGALAAACELYAKGHSFGEYVFDWAWADAHERCGVAYYPKLLLATPFTPVRGARLLGRDLAARRALLDAVLGLARRSGVSSLHLLFLADAERDLCAQAGLALRTTIQYHWSQPDGGWIDFDDFLRSLNHDKRKKIRQERSRLDAIVFRRLSGHTAGDADWALFARCYRRTYALHGSTPYLNLGFFRAVAAALPDHVLLLVASRDGVDIASSLVLLDPATGQAWGRYWGALEDVPNLHFEACYYQPIAYCIEHGYRVFEGGAQGRHKMARGLLPVSCTSAHWIAEPRLAEAIARHLDGETQAMDDALDELAEHAPFRRD